MYPPKQKLRFVRFMMVLSSFSPLLVLWAITGSRIEAVPNLIFRMICVILIITPIIIIYLRYYRVKKINDVQTFTVNNCKDQKDVLIIYLFAMLIPIYQTEYDNVIQFSALIVLAVFVFVLFWHLHLYYINLILAFTRFHTFMIQPTISETMFNRQVIIISKYEFLKEGQTIVAYRLTDTVFLEKEVVDGSEKT